MAYLALYRVWRPQTFIEVVGQEQTVIALQNAIREDRLTHAYIFSGPRGTGKTSIAKIVAKAVNCEHPVDAEPCNQCSACTDINNGNFMDVIEIDAASNRGIDEIRDLRERVRVMPAQGKKKFTSSMKFIC
jgi:DNA polymerase-3 subunit gamma/tau